MTYETYEDANHISVQDAVSCSIEQRESLQAVKYYRNVTSSSLRAAKEYIDVLIKELRS